jgi:hypothetical protein
MDTAQKMAEMAEAEASAYEAWRKEDMDKEAGRHLNLLVSAIHDVLYSADHVYYSKIWNRFTELFSQGVAHQTEAEQGLLLNRFVQATQGISDKGSVMFTMLANAMSDVLYSADIVYYNKIWERQNELDI